MKAQRYRLLEEEGCVSYVAGAHLHLKQDDSPEDDIPAHCGKKLGECEVRLVHESPVQRAYGGVDLKGGASLWFPWTAG
jgi:hypothetical protein